MFSKDLKELKNNFKVALDDNLSTPKALAMVFDFISKINKLIDKGKLSKKDAQKALRFLNGVDSVFGLYGKKTPAIPEEIKKLVDERELLREEKKWEEADEIRTKIGQEGYIVDDTTGGPVIKKF